MVRDAWLAWPARVSPLIAVAFDVQRRRSPVAWEEHVREPLAALDCERPEF